MWKADSQSRGRHFEPKECEFKLREGSIEPINGSCNVITEIEQNKCEHKRLKRQLQTKRNRENWKNKTNCKYKEFQESKDTSKSTSINKEVDEEGPQGKDRGTHSTLNQLGAK